jgi:hypothetical protein
MRQRLEQLLFRFHILQQSDEWVLNHHLGLDWLVVREDEKRLDWVGEESLCHHVNLSEAEKLVDA